MVARPRTSQWSRICAVLLASTCGFGCHSTGLRQPSPVLSNTPTSYVPRELEKTALPAYVIEPPDILLIEAVRATRLPEDPLQPLESLLIRATGTLPVDPFDDEALKAFKRISTIYRIDNEGFVDFGPEYGRVKVAGLTVERAREAIEQHLNETLKAPQISVEVADLQIKQQIAGEHLVGPDGTVALGQIGRASCRERV